MREKLELVGIPHYFLNGEETVYQIRMSQCKAHRKIRVKRTEPAGYYVYCASYPSCKFNILVRNTKAHGEVVTDGDGCHTCEMSKHCIEHAAKRTPASSTVFLACFIKDLAKANVTSGTALREYVYQQLNWYIFPSQQSKNPFQYVIKNLYLTMTFLSLYWKHM
jgi:hypothetical protein